MRISFLPPPLEGTISLGIYDGGGKLVRILQRESEVDEFEIRSDSLVTHWDGLDDSDKPLPPGKYHARGYAVGELQVEGIGFYFNDWISDKRPERVSRICAMAADADGVLVSAQLAPEGTETLICNSKGEVVTMREETGGANCAEDPQSQSVAAVPGKDRTSWSIEPSADGGAEVKQFSEAKELLRRLVIPREDPQPTAIAASREADRIYLLENDATTQRLRGLTLVATTPSIDHSTSDWRVDFEKKIIAHKNFSVVNGKPVAAGGTQPHDSVAVKLSANPLEKNESRSAQLGAGFDAEGSFLQTADGLPLQTISETTHLSRTVITLHDAKTLDLFQDDDAVVEQFRISGLDQMMAFDCGEIELK